MLQQSAGFAAGAPAFRHAAPPLLDELEPPLPPEEEEGQGDT